MAVDPSFLDPYATSPTLATRLITEVDTAYLFGIDKAEIAITDLPVVVDEGYQMAKEGPFRVSGRLVVYGQGVVRSAPSPITALPSTSVAVKYLDGSLYRTLQDHLNTMTSPGLITGGTITDAGSGNINVASGTAVIRSVDDDVGDLYFTNFDAATFAIPNDNTFRYIGLVYNSGVPVLELRTTDVWDNDTEIAIGSAGNFNGHIVVTNNPFKTGDPITNIIQRFDSLVPSNRDALVGGLALGETGTRNITMTAGKTWTRLNDFDIAAIDTSAGSFFNLLYYNGTDWIASGANQTQWPNTQYNDVTTGLVTMGNNKYANLWFYLETDHGHLLCIYGQAEYSNVADALVEGAPENTPDDWALNTLPIARLTFQKSAASATSISQAYTNPFTLVPATNHNYLAGLQGGTTSEYYHLTTAEYTGTGTGAFVRLNSPALTGTPTAPTQLTADNSTAIATTAFVKNQGYALDSTVVHLAGTETITGAKTFSAITTISNATASSSTVTGALVVTGGVGIGGAVYIGQQLNVAANLTAQAKCIVNGQTELNSTFVASASVTNTITNPYRQFVLLHSATVDGVYTIASLRSEAYPAVATGITNNSFCIAHFVINQRNTSSGPTDGNGSLNAIYGLESSVGHLNNTAAAPVTNEITGIRIRQWLQSGSCTNFFGIKIERSGTGGTATNHYGIFIDTVSFGGTANYAIYASGGLIKTIDATDATALNTGSIQTAGGLSVVKAAYIGGNIVASSGTASTSTVTGAIVVSGGVGISGATYIGGIISAAGAISTSSTTASTSTITGSIIAGGGLGVAGATYIGGILRVTDTTNATSTTTGSGSFSGGVSMGGDLWVGASAPGGNLVLGGSARAALTQYIVRTAAGYNRDFMWQTGTTLRWVLRCTATAESGSDAGSNLQLIAGDDAGAVIDTPLSIVRAAGGAMTIVRPISLTNTTDSTSISTGALIVSGGIGVAKYLTLDGGSGKTLRYTNATANGTVATTLGSKGPTGSTAGDPVGWMRWSINGTDRYTPFW